MWRNRNRACMRCAQDLRARYIPSCLALRRGFFNIVKSVSNTFVAFLKETKPNVPAVASGLGCACDTDEKDGTEWRTELNGSPGRIRTSDLTVNSRPLYRLSYRGAREQALFW